MPRLKKHVTSRTQNLPNICQRVTIEEVSDDEDDICPLEMPNQQDHNSPDCCVDLAPEGDFAPGIFHGDDDFPELDDVSDSDDDDSDDEGDIYCETELEIFSQTLQRAHNVAVAAE